MVYDTYFQDVGYDPNIWWKQFCAPGKICQFIMAYEKYNLINCDTNYDGMYQNGKSTDVTIYECPYY